MMKKYLLSLLVLLLGTGLSFGQVVYENFEGGPQLEWNPFGDGTFNGAVANPADQDPLGINNSAQVGSYTKSGAHAYSLLIAFTDEPMDLSVNNQFHIQINSSVASQFIFKLEGAGEAIERTINIGQTNTWIDYHIDLSAAAGFTTINKIIIFFDPGVTESADTYLFDNIRATAAGACAGTVADNLIVDDFECQRNGTIIIPGLLELSPLANPDASGINTSSTVGRYADVNGPWQALVYDWHTSNQFPLGAESSTINIKVWAPVAGVLKYKLEGGLSPAVERDVMITEVNTWVEYSVDFSDQVGASHEKLVFFFNAGVEPGADDIYYIDDISFSAPPAAEALEDFEPQKLAWESLGSAAVFGTFNGQIANPDMTAPNTTANVGSYTKGSSLFGAIRAQLPAGFNIGTLPQLNLDVWAPAGATMVSMKLFSPTEGLKEVIVELVGTQAWETLNFNFETFEAIADFERVEIQFGNTGNSGIWYFDNLVQGQSTVDPCADVTPVATIIDDFSCQRNATITNGLDRLEVVNNPVPGGLVPDPLNKVGRYDDPLDAWSALVWQFDGAVDLSTYNQLSVKVWSPVIVPMLFKLEGGTVNPVEVFTDVTATGQWVRYQIDFSDHVGVDHNKLAIFFGAGVEHGDQQIFYIDDVEWKRAPYTGCIATFDSPELTLPTWAYFGNNELEGTPFMMVENPAPDAVNGAGMVGVFQEAPGAQVWAGMFADLSAPIAMPIDNKTVSMKVWMDHAGPVVMKMEAGVDGAPNSGDVIVEYTTPNAWADLTFDYSFLPDGAQYNRITLILDIATAPEAEIRTSYFDDIRVAGGSCTTVGIFEPAQVDALRVMPNPVADMLRVQNPGEARTFRVTNMLGQLVRVQQFVGQDMAYDIDFTGLESGVYILTGYDATGRLVANAKVVKQ